jgi:purine nucleosidase
MLKRIKIVKPALIFLISIFLFILVAIFLVRSSHSFDTAPLVILDTDISSDVDDVGAVAVLHALANQKKAHILAMMVSSGDPWSAPCLDALNTWFGRPDIPIGMVKGKSVRHESKYTAAIAT